MALPSQIRSSCFKAASQARRSMFIQALATPNAESMKFKPGRPVLGHDGTLEFMTKKDARKSPLAADLFRIDGVASILFGSDFISVTKNTHDSWSVLKPDIFSKIMDFYSSNQEITTTDSTQQPSSTDIHPDDDEVTILIKELIETRIRPTIQEDGGDLDFVSFENGIVKLKLRGACRTCDSSVVTLKHGIENMLMHYVPEVKACEQVLDDIELVSENEIEKLEAGLKAKHARQQ